ncbi:glycosyltransferase family 4 protein [Gayadomonas joobiniege]|uniref:glycosyltransferase family 4 protein n=1 Tax=Gayadomonas joobiniege TaxID=1234606 RepID=UPI00035F1DE2|nr:glycosyltransferase family 4 protein [Gayadomonas joobiniege]
MKILHVLVTRVSLPPRKYGGTQRVVWSLAQAQKAQGHQVRFLWGDAPEVPVGTIKAIKGQPLNPLIGDWPDIVHFHKAPDEPIDKPYVVTEHFNSQQACEYDINTIFLSKKHAQLNGANCYVYNGLDWSLYGEPNLDSAKKYIHFLGKAKTATKNIQGAISISRQASKKLYVLGGHRFNFGRNAYHCLAPNVRFKGMVGGEKKNQLIANSAALLLPVRWHEPFGLAYIESLYLGCPVFATPYGSLPELIEDPSTGLLSDKSKVLAEGLADLNKFDRRACHYSVKDRFSAQTMAQGYQTCYEKVLAGEQLNTRKPASRGGLTELLPFS